MIHKTNAARILDSLKIKYDILEYEVDINNLDAITVSRHCNEPIENIYKTIVCEGESKLKKEYIVACIQGDLKLDLKSLAKVANLKSCELINLKNIEKITGYLRGGCSPIGMKHKFRTFIDERILNIEKVYVSAGIRGKQLFLNSNDLINAVEAKVCDITQS